MTGVRTKLNPTMLNALRAKENGFNFTLTPVIREFSSRNKKSMFYSILGLLGAILMSVASKMTYDFIMFLIV